MELNENSNGNGNGNFKKLARRDPRWLLSYADLMSLLFAMFVMLLSFSHVDRDAFQKNTGPIARAFTDTPPDAKSRTSTNPATGGSRALLDFIHPIPQQEEPEERPEDRADLEKLHQVKELAEKLHTIMANELKREQVDLIQSDSMVIIRFRDRAAFSLGDRELSPNILPTLDGIAAVLARTPGRIRIEGHTDDVPIATSLFRSNWDLSAARAASVVHYLLRASEIDPKRISAEGFADSRPLKLNDSAEGRAANRRVEIVIELQPDGQAEGWGQGKDKDKD